MLIITKDMPIEERKLATDELTSILKGILNESDWDHVCSAIIASYAVSILGDLASRLNHKLDEILQNKGTMFFIMNSIFVLDALTTALKPLHTPNLDVLLNAPQADARNVSIIGEVTCADLNLFCCWCIMHGADSPSVRKSIRTKEMKTLSACEKKHGPDYFISHLVRATSAIKALIDNHVRESCRKALRCEENRGVNSMATAFQALKRSA